MWNESGKVRSSLSLVYGVAISVSLPRCVSVSWHVLFRAYLCVGIAPHGGRSEGANTARRFGPVQLDRGAGSTAADRGGGRVTAGAA